MYRGQTAIYVFIFALSFILIGAPTSKAFADDASLFASLEPSAGVESGFETSLFGASNYQTQNTRAQSPRLHFFQDSQWDAGFSAAPKPYAVIDKSLGHKSASGASPFFSLRYRFQTK